MTQYQFVGVDVAKDKFDAVLETSKSKLHQCFSNNQSGYRAFTKWVNKHLVNPWICMEATGHYSELIADYLHSQDVRVSVVNPLQIKSFARAKLSRNKTDKIDAQIIMDYCEKMRPRTFLPRSDEHKELKDLSNFLDILKTQHVQLTNQLHSAQSPAAKAAIRKSLKRLEREIEKIEEKMSELIKKSQSLNDNMKLITSIKGVGMQTAFKILANVPNMGVFSNAKQFAAYIGISPKQHQSGKFTGKATMSRLGNAKLRKVFYMAALVAKRFNESLKPFVMRLEANGKAPKLIIGAVMRKLAHLIFGVLKNKRPFEANYV